MKTKGENIKLLGGNERKTTGDPGPPHQAQS